MSYLFFEANRTNFDDGKGNEVPLGDHLDYLRSQGGSPECFDSCDEDNRTVAMTKARTTGLHLYVVDEDDYRVVGVVNTAD
jgi:hypothetical protein